MDTSTNKQNTPHLSKKKRHKLPNNESTADVQVYRYLDVPVNRYKITYPTFARKDKSTY